MKKYFKLLYFGCYYWEWCLTRFFHRLLNPIGRKVIIIIPYIFPFIKKNLAKQGMTPEEYADNILKLGDKISNANISHSFEAGIALNIHIFFVFLLTDLFLILRNVFGYNWLGFEVKRNNVVFIGSFIVMLAAICMIALNNLIGTDKNEKEFRKQPKEVHHKALFIFGGSLILVVILFYFLWGHAIFRR